MSVMVVGEALAGIKSRTNNETGMEEPCDLKDLRKTFATYYGTLPRLVDRSDHSGFEVFP
jgi:hypothetical protein